jgi:tetratricopeptide (TPR) repeat protein
VWEKAAGSSQENPREWDLSMGGAMKPIGDPEDVAVLLSAYLTTHGWRPANLVRLSGVDPKSMSGYLKGKVKATRRNLERLARPGNLVVGRFEELLPLARSLRLGLKENLESQGELLAALAQEVTRAALAGLAPALLEIRSLAGSGRESPSIVDFPALCGWLCDESERASANDASNGMALATLGLHVAELAPEPVRAALLGYCWAFVGNARRVGGELTGADVAFGHSARLWNQGTPADLPLDGARLLDLKASLRKYQGRFEEALDLLHNALEIALTEASKGRILLKEATVLSRVDQYDQALGRLKHAEALIDADSDPRSIFGIRFNAIVNLIHLGNFQEADCLLPEVQKRAKRLGNALDLVRVKWLEGRLGAALGRRKEAKALFEEVKEEFTTRNIAYDAALVSLELAVLWLEEGRTGEVKELAEQMLWIFESQKVHKEALAALTLFREAAGREAATLELTRRVLGYLEKAQGAPGLRFGG